jgi:hypothetical protein
MSLFKLIQSHYSEATIAYQLRKKYKIMSTLEQPNNWPEMVKHFNARTQMHIDLVNKYVEKILSLGLSEISSEDLRGESHDFGKWAEPEYTPYVHLTWKYKTNGDYNPIELQDEINLATFHHIKTHKHHPEYWDSNVTSDHLNPRNRDEPSGKIVDATQMPLTFVAAMMADWLAMSEEKSTNVRDWYAKNVNIRWKFTKEQTNLMTQIMENLVHN